MDVPGLKEWIEDLSAQNRGLKNENESLRQENDSLKKQNAAFKKSLQAKTKTTAVAAAAHSGTKVKVIPVNGNDNVVIHNRPKIQLSDNVGNDASKINKDGVTVQHGNRTSTSRPNTPGHKRHSTTPNTEVTSKKAKGKSVRFSPKRNMSKKTENQKVKMAFNRVIKNQDKARASDKDKEGEAVTVPVSSTPTPPNKKHENEDDAEQSEERYEVEKILGTRLNKGKRQFLTKWKNWDEEDATWEPEENLECKDLVKEFLEANKGLLKASGTGTKKVDNKKNMLYCICHQPQNNRFMISCVRCEEWFHGKCVGVKTMGQWLPMKHTWLCPACHPLIYGNETDEKDVPDQEIIPQEQEDEEQLE